MLQASLLDCPFLDPFPFSENGFVVSEVDVCGCEVVEGQMVLSQRGYSHLSEGR